jgi:hypothetical protein
MSTCWASQAADNHAAAEDRAEARAEFVARFETDACDEMLAESGEVHYLIGDSDEVGALFDGLIWDADKSNAYGLLASLREALRAEVLKRYAEGVRARAEKLADAHTELMQEDYSAGRDALEHLGFPSIRRSA